jgi:hypothetical protein
VQFSREAATFIVLCLEKADGEIAQLIRLL